MDSPFNVTFIETFGDKENRVECEHFHPKSNPSCLLDEVTLTENSELHVSFTAPEGYRLYMDGFDQLTEALVSENGRGVYIKPASKPTTLYNPRANNKPYPFIPGTYVLLLATPEGEERYTRVKIMTKRMTEEQHEVMVSEIEATVKGLSSELSSRRSVFNDTALAIFGPEKIHEYSILLMNADKLISSIHTINKTKKFSIRKVYPVMPTAKAKRIDEKSIKYMMMHPEQQKTIQAPVSQITYDLLENSWIKSIATLFYRYVTEMKVHFATPFSTQYNETTAKQLERELSVLQNQLALFLQESWLRDVSEITSGRIPMVFFKNGTYNTFYKIYRLLKESNRSPLSQPQLQFQHKRSDVLYEIWGYLQVIRMFQESGYTLEKNGLHINQNTLDKISPSTTKSTDYVQLTKDHTTLRIFYDEFIPNSRSALSTHQTMYTMNNNKPDCRIDAWHKAHYKGSLIIDFKYRKREYLWNEEDLQSGRQPSKVMKQLESYASSMKSNSQLINGVRTPLIDAQPVTEVWAVYPIKWENPQANYEANDFCIRFIDLSPGSESLYFRALLESAIEGILER